MRKPDELALARGMLTYDPYLATGEGMPLHVRIGMSPKRWAYIIRKWTRRGFLERVGSTEEIEYPAFNHVGYRYWNNALAVCESFNDRCTGQSDMYTHCPHAIHGAIIEPIGEPFYHKHGCNGKVYNRDLFIRECIAPLLLE